MLMGDQFSSIHSSRFVMINYEHSVMLLSSISPLYIEAETCRHELVSECQLI